MDIQELQTDATKIDGVWIDYFDGASFQIASIECTGYKKRLSALSRKQNPAKIRKDPTIVEEISKAAMAETILLDFKGVNNGGKPMKNSLANRKALLEIATIRNWVADQAQDLANFQAEGEADDVAAAKSDAELDS